MLPGQDKKMVVNQPYSILGSYTDIILLKR